MYTETTTLPSPRVQTERDSPTISGVEMARITGVGRERLRTWERRHGFPEPVRTAQGIRRYLAADVRRVAAVASAIETGMSVAQAIELEQSGAFAGIADGTSFADELLTHCAVPALAITGPRPLQIAWVNRETLATPEAPALGSELLAGASPFGPAALSQIQELMGLEGPQSCEIEHQDWTSAFPVMRRSLAWRLPASTERQATVVVMQLPSAPAPTASLDLAPTTSWVRGLAKARMELQEARGISSVQRALGILLRSTGGVDGFLGVSQRRALRTATSVAGTVPATTFMVEPDGRLESALSSDSLVWLDERAAADLGAPSRSRTLVVPIVAGGNRIGAAFLVYRAEVATGEMVDEMLLGFGMALGLTLQREHLTPGARREAA